MKSRFFIVASVLCLLTAYTVWRLVDRIPDISHPVIITGLITFLLVGAQIAAPLCERLIFPKISKTPISRAFISIVLWTSYIIFGSVSCLFIYSIIADIIEISLKLADAPISVEALDQRILLALISFTVLTIAIGVWQARSKPVVRRVNIKLTNLPKSFDGFTIAQISDLHVGATIGLNFVKRAADVVNGLNPDLVVITGDLADGLPKDLRDFLKPLSTLKSRHGSYYITGNHEYYWGAEEWLEEGRKLGFKTLVNQHDVITRGNDKIILAGVTDISSKHFPGNVISSPKNSLKGAPKDSVKILLAHQPVSYIEAEAAGFDLQLSGHTHGGQFFPFNLLIRFFQRYYKGLNHYKNMQIYVSTGTGYWGPPLRTGVRSEVSLITLKSA